MAASDPSSSPLTPSAFHSTSSHTSSVGISHRSSDVVSPIHNQWLRPADLAVFMHPSTPWDTEWYSSSSPIPPHLKGSPDIRFSGSFGHSGRTKTARGVILFSDLSICWYSVEYGSGPVTRWARFRPRPEPLSGSVLQQAAETYGAAVAEFAERAEASGRPVARGE